MFVVIVVVFFQFRIKKIKKNSGEQMNESTTESYDLLHVQNIVVFT